MILLFPLLYCSDSTMTFTWKIVLFCDEVPFRLSTLQWMTIHLCIPSSIIGPNALAESKELVRRSLWVRSSRGEDEGLRIWSNAFNSVWNSQRLNKNLFSKSKPCLWLAAVISWNIKSLFLTMTIPSSYN